jgi:hypothetical protein
MNAIIFEKEGGGISTISFANGEADPSKVPNGARYKIVDSAVLNAALTEPNESYKFNPDAPLGAELK